jgi:hypothetical protein
MQERPAHGNFYIHSHMFFLIWLAVTTTVMRWTMRRSADAMQSRLERWAVERGYKIIRQECPPEAPLSNQFAVWGPFFWIFSPGNSAWVLDVQVKPGEMNIPTLSTCVTLEDREGRFHRGRMQYIGTHWGAFGSSVESRWEEEGVDHGQEEKGDIPGGGKGDIAEWH